MRRLLEDNSGATAVEYGLIVAMLVVASLVAYQGLANENTRTWMTISSKVMASANSAA
ncbi:MAG TPA: Flp family type IVb pilin [Novosphingobium sp.]|nr:Flp family type IVb pilin [Novosphingobium sp.]HMP57261.1 Flp family type IVb pilin [Novosphingobium sp.]